MVKDRRKRRGIFAIIRSRDDALQVVTDAAIAFLAAAAVLVAMMRFFVTVGQAIESGAVPGSVQVKIRDQQIS